MPQLSDFAKGTTVTYIGSQSPLAKGFKQFNVGRTAVVKRAVKSRGVVTIAWNDTGDWYDAFPENLALVAP